MSLIQPALKSARLGLLLILLVTVFSYLTALAATAQGKARKRGTADNRSSARSNRGARNDNNREGRRSRVATKDNGLNRKRSNLRSRRAAELTRRRAEAARLAAIARQRAAEEAMRDRVQSLIAKDDATGEDAEIRRVAVNALGNHAGTVVVMNPKTGRVYTIVNQQWALREGFKPCSTIKLVTGLAGLNERVIDPQDTAAISDTNQVSLTSALAHSKNEYFQTVGGQVGFSKMISYARQLGLGEKTGINVRDETAGRVPQSKRGFAVNHMSSHGDDFKVTALQLATLVSAMSNGGKLLKPFVSRSAQPGATPKVRRVVTINSDAFRSMLPGMIGAVSYGSGRKAFDPREIIAGKTGTCIEHGNWVGLFTSYAPANDPELAIVVIAKGSDGRNHFPAAVAGRIYRELNRQFASAKAPDAGANRAPAANQAVTTSDADLDSDEEEAEEAAAERSSDNAVQPIQRDRTVWGAQRRPADSKVRPTILSIPNRSQTTNGAQQRLRRSSAQLR